jgi:hypothetical protein
LPACMRMYTHVGRNTECLHVMVACRCTDVEP